jgi:hypothetical protein
MLRLNITLISGSLLLACFAAPAADAATQIVRKVATVAVKFPGGDPLTIKFRKAMNARLRRDKQLKLVSDMNTADLRILSPSKSIDWDTIAGRLVVIYIVNLKGHGATDFRLSGVCFATNMDKCARELLSRSKHYVLGL